MSPDDIDSLIVAVIKFIEIETDNGNDAINFDDDAIYNRFEKLIYDKLEKFCTRDRNYN